MIHTRKLALGLVGCSVALAGFLVTPALAVPPRSGSAEVRAANQAVARVNKLASSSVLTLQRLTSGRIALLAKLDARGATDEQLIGVANASKSSITANRVRIENRIRSLVDSVIVKIADQDKNLPVITSGLLASLESMATADELLAEVITARDNAINIATDAEIQGLTEIDAALASLLTPAP